MSNWGHQPSLFGATYLETGLTNDALEIACRGDGRTYILNVRTDGLGPEDVFQAFLYTRGGPHWQTARIPYNEFLLTTMGFVRAKPGISLRRVSLGLFVH